MQTGEGGAGDAAAGGQAEGAQRLRAAHEGEGSVAAGRLLLDNDSVLPQIDEDTDHRFPGAQVDGGEAAAIRAGGAALCPAGNGAFAQIVRARRQVVEDSLRFAVHRRQIEVSRRQCLAREGEGGIAPHRPLDHDDGVQPGIGEGAGHILARVHGNTGRIAAIGTGGPIQPPARRRRLAEVIASRDQVGEGALCCTACRRQRESAQRLADKGEDPVAAGCVLDDREAAPLRILEGADHFLPRRQIDIGRAAPIGAGSAREIPACRYILADCVDAWRQVGKAARGDTACGGQAEVAQLLADEVEGRQAVGPSRSLLDDDGTQPGVDEEAAHGLPWRQAEVVRRRVVVAAGETLHPAGRDGLGDVVRPRRQPGEGVAGRTGGRGQHEGPKLRAAEGECAIAAGRPFLNDDGVLLQLDEDTDHRLPGAQIDVRQAAAIGTTGAAQRPAGGDDCAQIVGARRQVREGPLGFTVCGGHRERTQRVARERKSRIPSHRAIDHNDGVQLGVGKGAGHILARIDAHAGRAAAIGAGGAVESPT